MCAYIHFSWFLAQRSPNRLSPWWQEYLLPFLTSCFWLFHEFILTRWLLTSGSRLTGLARAWCHGSKLWGTEDWGCRLWERRRLEMDWITKGCGLPLSWLHNKPGSSPQEPREPLVSRLLCREALGRGWKPWAPISLPCVLCVSFMCHSSVAYHGCKGASSSVCKLL